MKFRIALSFATITVAAFACSHQAEQAAQSPASEPALPASESTANSSAELSAQPTAAKSDPTFVTSFEAKTGELPEGLALRDGAAYVGFAPTASVMRYDLAKGSLSKFGSLPAPVANKGFMTGLDFDKAGNLYAALVSFVDSPKAGIYRLSPSGGEATLFAQDANMKFPNGLAFYQSNLFVTDSASGSVYKITPEGKLSTWASGELLKGNKDFCGKGVGAPFDIGANGIVQQGQDFYVSNNDKASVVRIPIQADGSAGPMVNLTGSKCDELGGADGIALSSRGDFVVATNRLNRLVRFDKAGHVERIADGGMLDFPASVAFDKNELFVTNFALFSASAGKPSRPGLIKLFSN